MPLSRRFFARPADVVARALLGKRLVHRRRAGIIVEAEAYLGEHDLASHARFGPTDRNRVMYGRAGISYVYLCYGVHEMFNIVTGKPGEPEAVLIRALDVGEGEPRRAAGPGKLTRALAISRTHNELDLTESAALFVERGRRFAAARVRRGPRIGVDYAGAWRDRPLRFWIDGHPAVSR